MTKTKFYTLSCDRLFKTIMMEDKNRTILETILSEILERNIVIKRFMPMERPVNGKNNKENTLDMIIETINDEIIDVEVNTHNDKALRERNFSYVTSLYEESVRRDDNKKTYKHTIQVNLNFGDVLTSKAIDTYKVRNDYDKLFLDSFEIISVNVDRIKKECYDKNVQGEEKYKYLSLLGSSKEELEELSKTYSDMKGVIQEMFIFNSNGTYSRKMSREDDIRMESENRGFYKGEASGIVKGEKIGFDKGEKIGIDKGIDIGEKQEQEKIAKTMIKDKMPLNKIKQYTGLTEKVIRSMML